jgi:hypothetical protein
VWERCSTLSCSIAFWHMPCARRSVADPWELSGLGNSGRTLLCLVLTRLPLLPTQALKHLSKQAEEDDAAPVGLIYTKGLLYDTS